MLLPVGVLTLLTIFGGALQTTALGFGTTFIQDFLAPAVGKQGWEGGGFEVVVTFITLVLATLAFLLAYLFYVGREERRARFWDAIAELSMAHPRPWNERLPRLQSFLEHKWYFDELYDAVVVRPMDWLARAGDRWIDRPVIEGSLTGVADAVEDGAGGLSLVQSGYLRAYVLVFVFGALVAAAIILYRGGIL
jgi:NADH-quinone oxidoreductase subunit L